MGIDDIVRATDDVLAQRSTKRFVEQVGRKSYDEPNVTVANPPTASGERVAVDITAAPGTDFKSGIMIDPNDTERVEQATIRLGETTAPNQKFDPDVAQAQENFLEREVGRVVNELGIGTRPETRIRREVPGPTEPEKPVRFVPHADFKGGVRRDDLLRFLDRGPEQIVTSFSDFLDDLL